MYNHFEFTHQFLRFLLLDRIMFQKDNIVLVTGKRGDGKSTLSISLIRGFIDMAKNEEYYNFEINKGKEEAEKKVYSLGDFKPFDFENDMAFTRADLQDLCRKTMRGFILADEAVVNVARRNSMTRANKVLHEVLTINRKNLNTLFFCMPSIEDFDLAILQYVTHWIHIDDRGVASIMLPEAKSIFGKKSWDVDGMKKLYEKFKEENPRLTKVPYWLFNNFRGYIRFGPLTAGVEREYLRIANEKKNRDTEKKFEEEMKSPEPRIPKEKMALLCSVVDKLTKCEIIDSSEYYEYCSKLEYDKTRLNKEISNILIAKGEGRSPHVIIRENKKQKEAEYVKNLEQPIFY